MDFSGGIEDKYRNVWQMPDVYDIIMYAHKQC
jgi:hypothetical protein